MICCRRTLLDVPRSQAGVHPKVVQERLGHSTIGITLDVYSHVLPSMETDAADRVAALILGVQPVRLTCDVPNHMRCPRGDLNPHSP